MFERIMTAIFGPPPETIIQAQGKAMAGMLRTALGISEREAKARRVKLNMDAYVRSGEVMYLEFALAEIEIEE